LNRRGFRTEERLGADNISWLVLATYEAFLTEALITATHRAMETVIAQNGGGEYDGWEAEARAAKPN
jgi:Regulator of ribonuclease activity B